MEKKESQLYKFLKSCVSTIKSARIPLYSNKFSKKTYNQHQHLANLCLMKYMKEHYRDIVDVLVELSRIRKLLKLKKIPHFTTLQKFFKRFPSWLFEKILFQTLKLFQLSELGLGIDGSGYSSDNASKYYTQRIKGKVERKYFIKDSIVVDVDKQVIIANKSRKAPSHDNKDFKPLIKKCHRRVKIRYVSADKAYDDEKNHLLASELGFKTNIPIRTACDNPKGRFRVKSFLGFDHDQYHQRSKVETVFSVIKRKFESVVHSRLMILKKKEVKLKNIVYNIYRKVKMDSDFWFLIFLNYY